MAALAQREGRPPKKNAGEGSSSVKGTSAASEITSVLTTSQLDSLRVRYFIPNDYELVLPKASDRANSPPSGCISVYVDCFEGGFRLPLHPFFQDFLSFAKMAAVQFSPNTWRALCCFLHACADLDVTATMNLFRYLFTLTTHPQDPELCQLQARAGVKFIKEPRSSVHGWKGRFFFVRCLRRGSWNFPEWGVPDAKARNLLPELSVTQRSALQKFQDKVRESRVRRMEPYRADTIMGNPVYLHQVGIISDTEFQAWKEDAAFCAAKGNTTKRRVAQYRQWDRQGGARILEPKTTHFAPPDIEYERVPKAKRPAELLKEVGDAIAEVSRPTEAAAVVSESRRRTSSVDPSRTDSEDILLAELVGAKRKAAQMDNESSKRRVPSRHPSAPADVSEADGSENPISKQFPPSHSESLLRSDPKYPSCLRTASELSSVPPADKEIAESLTPMDLMYDLGYFLVKGARTMGDAEKLSRENQLLREQLSKTSSELELSKKEQDRLLGQIQSSAMKNTKLEQHVQSLASERIKLEQDLQDAMTHRKKATTDALDVKDKEIGELRQTNQQLKMDLETAQEKMQQRLDDAYKSIQDLYRRSRKWIPDR